MTTSTAVHSQAFSFMSFLQYGVDPRTGQYTVTINFPDIKSNDLCGPDLPLSLAFNPLNTLDSGFGLGWNLNLSQFTPHNSMLALSTGETFKVTGSGPTPDIKEKKLDSFHFENKGGGIYRVLHKSGLIEILDTNGSSVALPAKLYSPAGHSISLTYASFRGGRRLETVSDAQGQLLQINRPHDSSVEILLRPYDGPGGGPLARYELKLTGGEVREVVLPTAEQASWRFNYESIRGILCLRDVKTPVGGHETIDYRDEGHRYPDSAARPNLPRVTCHRTYPGFEQPMMEVLYSYNPLDNHHNFLGNGADISWADDGLDNLFKVTHTYAYASTATLMADGKEVRRVDRTYNRFHLLTEEKTTQAHCVKRVLTTYYAKDEPFENQDPQYQLPTEILTSWEMENDSTQYRAEETSTQFDDHGNLIEEVQADKIKTTYSYYSKDGEDGCPPDPEGFVRNRKDATVYPSPLGQGDAPTLRTRYRYSALVPLTASGLKDWLVVDSETLLQVAGSHESELQQTLRSYIVEPANAFRHGRPLQQRETLNGKTTTTDYQYKPDSVLAGETVLQTVETLTGFDHVAGVNEVQKVITREDSRVHGQPLLTHDDNGVMIRYTYDLLERVTSETVAPGETEFEATRYYEYYLTSLDGQQAEQVVTDVKEVKTRTRFDGLNRPIYEERQNADSLLRAKDYRQTYAGVYDALGNLIKETDYDWEDENPVPLTSLFEYDAWGAQRSVTGPDRVTVYEETDPIGTPEWRGPIQRSWRQGVDKRARSTGVTETWLNLFEKPAQSRRFESRDPGEKPVSLHQYSYDGLGRTTEEVDARDAKTQYSYDVFGRMLTNTLPGGAVVRRSYAEHSPEDLPTEISVNNIVLGKQRFDGLNRMTRSITGGREQIFTYEPGQTQPATVTTASKQLINYVYQPKLGEEPLQRRLPNSITADYEYDKKNARLISCKEQDQQLVRQYFSTGELKAEQRVQGGESYSMHYSYSRHARLLSYTDVLKQTQSYHYDLAGRLQRTELGTTTSSFTYDGLSQTETIHTEDSLSGQSVTISLEYDAFGRETKRTFDLDGVEQQLTQVYNEVDALVQRTLYEGQTLLRDEKYDYDPRGRLVIYECEGRQRPVDPYGKAITRQLFRFDALDNLTRVITTSTDGITTYTNQAIYTFDTTDPTQLSKVTNTGDLTYPPEILLSYDENGNLTRDEENRTLVYDALNRLISVSGLPGETPSGFDYDALDRLAGLNDGAEQRFYQDGALATRIQGAQRHTFMRGEGNLLAEQQEGAGPKSLLLASDNKNTVLREIGSRSANDIAYSAYGHRSAEQPVSTHLGYNGQFRETQTGCYLLGNGYRAYNPWLMRFCSPDSWSPFGEGGLNAYMYCGGEPIMNADDSGHMFKNLFGSRPKVSPKLPDPPATPKPANAFRAKIADDNDRWAKTAGAKTVPQSGTPQASGSSSRGNTGMPEVKQAGGAGIQTNNETDSFYSKKAQKLLGKAEEQYLKTIQKPEAPPPLPPTVSAAKWKKMDVFARDAHLNKGGLLPNDVQVQKVRRTPLDRSKKPKKK